MDSDIPDSPEAKNNVFTRNLKIIGAIVVMALIVGSFYVFVYSEDKGVDPDFAKENAFLAEGSLRYWYVSYLTDTSLYNFEVSAKYSDTHYLIHGADGEYYDLNIYEEEEDGVMKTYAQLTSDTVESPPSEISIYFDVKSYIATDPFTSIPETVGYEYLDQIYLLFSAWENEGVENQQLAYGMSYISEAVGKQAQDIDKITIDEIKSDDNDYYVDIYEGKIGTPTKPVIYVMTETGGAVKNHIVIPFDGIIILEVPNYEDIGLFSTIFAEIIAPSSTGEDE